MEFRVQGLRCKVKGSWCRSSPTTTTPDTIGTELKKAPNWKVFSTGNVHKISSRGILRARNVLTEVVVRKSFLGVDRQVHLNTIRSEARNVTNLATTRMSSRGLLARNSERYVANFAPHEALK